MIKYLPVLIFAISPAIAYTAQDLYAEILNTRVSGNLISPFKEFSLQISLTPDDNSVSYIDLSIDNRPVKISLPEKFNVRNVLLSSLEITHSPIHAPNAGADGIIGVGPAYLKIKYRYYSAEHCESGTGEISISTRMDTLVYEVDGECLDNSLA
ncbi:hypothetical protein [Microbulbifer sp. SSSA005]|uniref:hypothetical protein n=1 Tax=Microbulbifer sp. SSSA005 TaxID=3243378 RepID=UPI004039CE81